MLKNIIGTILILISFVVSGINWLYLEPRGMDVIPYWILVVSALSGGFIKYYKTNQENTNENLNKKNGKLRKIGMTIDNVIDALSGHIDSDETEQRIDKRPKK
ncbi:hypothetical protein [Virgibacillus sp. 6R]|uniref:hypothetical protein n=1 Tax=Metabacillus sp. 22489 TaxID=3453928 RepID=UPI00119FDEBE